MARSNEPAVERWQELADLRGLIEAHRSASIAWGDAFDAEERRSWTEGETVVADLEAATRLEEDARRRLLTWRPATLRGESERLRYLLCDPAGPWKGMAPAPDEIDLLITSIGH